MELNIAPTDILDLVTQAGVDAWIEQEKPFTIVYDRVGTTEDGQEIFRSIYDVSDKLYLLVDASRQPIETSVVEIAGIDDVVDDQTAKAKSVRIRINASTAGFEEGALPLYKRFLQPRCRTA